MKKDNWKRSAIFFIMGQFVSMFGSMLVQYAITWHITLETQSGIWMTLFTCAGLLPMVIISPFAGVWADRYNRKYIINISDGVIAVTTLILAILFMNGYENMWLMLFVVTIRGFGQGIQSPAVSALIPQIVPEDSLIKVGGIQTAVQSITMFASPMIAGALLTFMPMEYIMLIDVFTAIIGISIVFLFVKVKKIERNNKSSGIKAHFNELKEGIKYIGGIKWLKLMMIYLGIFVIFMTPASILTPLQVARSFGDDVWRLTAIEIAFAVGMMLGGIAISVWGGFKNKVYTMILACFAFGITTFLFGVVPNFIAYVITMLICGASAPLFNTPSQAMMQSKLDPAIMGRVFSVMMMINGIAMPLGMVIFGPLSDVIKIEILLIVTGLLMVAGGFVLIVSKTLIKAGIPD